MEPLVGALRTLLYRVANDALDPDLMAVQLRADRVLAYVLDGPRSEAVVHEVVSSPAPSERLDALAQYLLYGAAPIIERFPERVTVSYSAPADPGVLLRRLPGSGHDPVRPRWGG